MTRSIRVGILGHWGGNIGHEIMALGVECVLKKAFDDQVGCWRIEQHRPFAIYPKWHPLRYMWPLHPWKGGTFGSFMRGLVNRREISTFLWRSSWVDILDLGIACGGPLIKPSPQHNDLGLLFHHMPGALVNKGVPFLNLSVGSCYPWEKTPDTINANDLNFYERIFEYSHITTFRDELAQRICINSLGQQGELIQDTGLMAGRAFSKLARGSIEGRYIVVNYLKYGANDDWGQNVDPMMWKSVLKNLIRRLQRRHKIVFLCHNEYELTLAEELDATIPRYCPRTMQEYAQVISGALAGICNRLHAAIPLASIGAPAIGVGTDSRLGTLQAIGLPCFYVKDVNVELLEDTLENLIRNRMVEHERLVALREKALNKYVGIVRNAITD